MKRTEPILQGHHAFRIMYTLFMVHLLIVQSPPFMNLLDSPSSLNSLILTKSPFCRIKVMVKNDGNTILGTYYDYFYLNRYYIHQVGFRGVYVIKYLRGFESSVVDEPIVDTLPLVI